MTEELIFPDSDYITRRELLSILINRIEPSALDKLKHGKEGLVISDYNRQTILRMVDYDFTGSEVDESVETDNVKEMAADIQAYLRHYMADRPEGHIWIVLCCLFLAFVANEPLHPMEIARWRFDGAAGKYLCPMHEDGEGSICRYCRCVKG